MAVTDARPEKLPRELVVLFGVLFLGILLMQLDGTMVGISLETLTREFTVPVSASQWVLSAYLLAMTVSIPIAGWAADRYGSRTMWNLCIGLFLAGSVACALATELWVLVLARAVQGFAGGVMIPVGQATVVRVAGVERRAQLMGLMALPALIGPTLGPTLGGLIVSEWSWRWMFWINVPLCLLAMAVAARRMPNLRTDTAGRLDVRGLLLVSPGLAAAVFGLSRAGTAGFGDTGVLVALGAGVALLAGFVIHATRSGSEPLLPLRLLAVRSYGASTALLVVLGFAMGLGVVSALFVQQVWEVSALATGLLAVPAGIGSAIVGVNAGKLLNRFGPRTVSLVALVPLTAGGLVYPNLGPEPDFVWVSVAGVLGGLGLGALMAAALTAVYVDVPMAQVARASSGMRAIMQFGMSAGIAVVAVILQTRLALGDPVAAYTHTFWWCLGFSLLALLPVLLLPRSVRPA